MYRGFFKRFFDFMFALLGLIVLSPIFLITAISVSIFLGVPILFKQKRPGLHGKVFTVYKFRTMNDKKDINGELLPDHIRLTPFGKLLRKTSLDELPQLINVLKGDMSFIGPRPLLVEYLDLYTEEQAKRHDVRPGITGWAQVNGRNAISWNEKFNFDVYYTKKISLKLDMKIFLMTIAKVLKQADISSNTSVTVEKFSGTKNEGYR